VLGRPRLDLSIVLAAALLGLLQRSLGGRT
jgi:hypothetical protein